jgi:hypothetical protein
MATIAFYGPTNEFASKVVVGIIPTTDAPVSVLEKWFSSGPDVRTDPYIGAAMLKMLEAHKAVTVTMTRGVFGCPHEEGIDYPEGGFCPQCPFWKDRDRWKEV